MKKALLAGFGLVVGFALTACAPQKPDTACIDAPDPAVAAVPGGIFSCSAESGLKSLPGTPSLAMSFVNQSGSDLKLYWINFQGERVSYGPLQNSQSRGVMTFVSHPWIITGADDRCIELILPGRTTRTVALQPGQLQ